MEGSDRSETDRIYSPLLIETLISILIWLIIGVAALIIGFTLVTVQRRVTRRRFFQQLDHVRHQIEELLEPGYRNPGDPEGVVASLRPLRSKVERQALEEALLRHAKAHEDLAVTRQIVKKLGWIHEWTDVLRSRDQKPAGTVREMLAELGDDYRPPKGTRRLRLLLRANFVERCRAADKLGQVPTPQGMWALLAGATDPHADVQEICLRYLGQLADPATLPVLIEELIKIIEGRSPHSVRNIKTALVQFSIEDVGAFLVALQHPNRRVRFFATDIVREIADRSAATALLSKNDFTPEIYRLFTEQFYRDEWADVRARAAVVIAHFHDDTSSEVLRKLLEDEVWFVRMHACRAVANKLYLPLAPFVVQCLTDSNWLVREAATRTLAQMGDLGMEYILEAFIQSQDRYAAEQICEELQRSGLLVTMLDSVPEQSAGAALTDSALLEGHTLSPEEARRLLVAAVVRKMVSTEKITMLLMLLRGPIRPVLKLLLLGELTGCFTPDCLGTFQFCAEADPDPKVREVALAAFQNGLALATAASLEAHGSEE